MASTAQSPPRSTPLRLQAGPAPHWRSPLSRRALNLALLLGLSPAITAALVVFGWGALARLALAGGAAVLVEMLLQRVMNQPRRYGDLSALVQGLLLAMLLPPTAPWWMLLIGVFLMIFIGKQLFGGVGGYPFNPVLIGWSALLLSWGNRVHPVADQLLGTAWTPSIAIGGAVLLILGHIDWQTPVGVLAGVVIGALVFSAAGVAVGPWDAQLLAGSVLLGAFFLATDTTCSPSNRWARLLNGLIAGALIIMLRAWGVWPEPVPFALLLACALTPLLDRIRPRPRRRMVRHG